MMIQTIKQLVNIHLILSLLDDGLHDQAGPLHDGHARVLEQPEQGPTPASHLVQQHVKLLPVCSLAVMLCNVTGY